MKRKVQERYTTAMTDENELERIRYKNKWKINRGFPQWTVNSRRHIVYKWSVCVRMTRCCVRRLSRLERAAPRIHWSYCTCTMDKLNPNLLRNLSMRHRHLNPQYSTVQYNIKNQLINQWPFICQRGLMQYNTVPLATQYNAVQHRPKACAQGKRGERDG